jgi:hypothetical protein
MAGTLWGYFISVGWPVKADARVATRSLFLIEGQFMKRLFFFLLISTLPAHAACTGSGTSWSCQAGTTSAEIQAAVNSAADGAVITLAAGSYAVSARDANPHYGVDFSNNKGVTIICATPPSAVGAATVNPCIFNTSNFNAFGGVGAFGGTNTHFYRISGFVFDGGGPTGSPGTGGVIWWDNYNGSSPATLHGPNGLGGIRVDHNTFQNYKETAEVVFVGHASGVINVSGVVDHNLFTNPNQFAAIFWLGAINPTPPPSQLGTVNNLFFEDNTITFTAMANSSNAGCSDGWGGAALVIRHNTSVNCMWAMHGATHSGGPANYEFYNNSTTLNAKATGDANAGGDPTTIQCERCLHHQGSGTIMAFNNTFTIPAGNTVSHAPMVVQDYRAYAHGPSIDGALPACDGTVVNSTRQGVPFSDGNRTPSGSNYGYPCRFQAGRDSQGNYKPMYAWNNTWPNNGGGVASFVVADSGGAIPNGSFPPNNCNTAPTTGTCDYFNFHMKNDREWFNAVSPLPNTVPGLPFDGTTGMGFGPLANRPASCTTSTETAFDPARGAGVGYFATDQGPQGTLYTCSATNTWAIYYIPYTYPHPLQGGGNTSSVASPTNLSAVVN